MINTKDFVIGPELMAQIDFYNSVNGGVAQSESTVTEGKEGYQIFLRVPGITLENLSIEIIRQRVIVYVPQNIVGASSNKKSIRVVGNFQIPLDVNIAAISAAFDTTTKRLIVDLPYNDFYKSYRSKVEIFEK